MFKNLYLGTGNGVVQLGYSFRATNGAELVLHANGNAPSAIMFGQDARTDANTKWMFRADDTGNNNNFVLYRGPKLGGFNYIYQVSGSTSQTIYEVLTD